MSVGDCGTGDAEARIAYLNRCMLSVLLMLPMDIGLGPEPLHCPACGMARDRCLAVFGRDPVHEQDARDRLDAGWPYVPNGG